MPKKKKKNKKMQLKNQKNHNLSKKTKRMLLKNKLRKRK